MSSTEFHRKEKPTSAGASRPRRSAKPDRPAEERAPEPEQGLPGGPKAEASNGSAAEPASRPIGWTSRDFLSPYILLALSIQHAHGYFIEQYLRGLGMVDVEMSTLYRTLRQMERDGLVLSTWEPGPDGPARRIYRLTDTGRWWLDAGASALAGYRSLIDRFFGNYSGPSGASKSEDAKKKK